MDKNIKQLADHYDGLVRKFGAAPQSAQWSDRETQFRRFSVLTEIMQDRQNSDILDIGCGTASLLAYLKDAHDFKGQYQGVDISSEAIKLASEMYPEQKFAIANLLEQPLADRHDYVVMCGIFNNRLSDDAECGSFIKQMLKCGFEHANKGMAFNVMSKYVDFEAENLCYFQPEELFGFCKQHLSPNVTLRHDYNIKDGVIPFEFTIYVYRT